MSELEVHSQRELFDLFDSKTTNLENVEILRCEDVQYVPGPGVIQGRKVQDSDKPVYSESNRYAYTMESYWRKNNIARFKKLRNLSFSGGGVICLPSSMVEMTELRSLKLCDTGLQEVPDVIMKLTWLTILELGCNSIRKLPLDIDKLHNLQILVVSCCRLSTLPESIVGMKNLIKLNVGNNPLKILPSVICEIATLRELHIGGCCLQKLPTNIGKLTNLEVLNIPYNDIQYLPPSICNLTNLRELRLWNNPIARLPANFSLLSNLQGFAWDRLDGEVDIPAVLCIHYQPCYPMEPSDLRRVYMTNKSLRHRFTALKVLDSLLLSTDRKGLEGSIPQYPLSGRWNYRNCY